MIRHSASTVNRNTKNGARPGGDCFCLQYLLSDESWRIELTQKTMEMDFCVVFCDKGVWDKNWNNIISRISRIHSYRLRLWGVISAKIHIFNYANGNCIYEVQLCYYDIRYCDIRLSFGVKQSLLKFHSAWNSHYWNSHSAWHSETKIRLPIRHGTQKAKFDIRFSGKNARKRHTSKPGPDSDPDSKKIRTQEKPGPGPEKNPDSSLRKPGLDFRKPGLEIEKPGFKPRTLCTRMERFFAKV